MLKNYLKVAIRSLWKNKGFSAINIVGLAIGLATCLLILLYVTDELSYDRFNKNAERIYRVDGDIRFAGTDYNLAVAPDPLGPTLLRDYPQVEAAVRLRDYGGLRVQKGNQNLIENRVIYADASIFSVFTLPMLFGDPATALKEPHTIVISASTAKKYFNTTNVVGKSMVINDTSHYTITGVIRDMPAQSHFRFDLFISLAESAEAKWNTWMSNNFNTYVLLREGTDPAVLQKNMEELVPRYVADEAKAFLHIGINEFNKAGNHIRYLLTPLTSIHLHSSKVSELAPNGSVEYVYIFSAVAVFILLIACVNFMNLSTARSSNRAREVGVRKVLGSMRGNLIAQFLSESILVSFLALVLACVIAWSVLPYFNQLSGKELTRSQLLGGWMLPASLLIVLLVGLLAGSYPAFYLSAFQPIQVLKGRLVAGFKTGWLRNSLVVFQFAISIFLIIGTVVIYNQLNYIQQKNLGFNRDQVLVIHNSYALKQQAKAFREEITRMPAVESATMTGYLPTNLYRNDNTYFLEPTMDQHAAISLQTWFIDDNYIPTLGMQMAAGRNFSKDMPTDSQGVILNEAAVKMLGLRDPLNYKLYSYNDPVTKKVQNHTIVGVVKDFNFNSLRQEVTPLGLFLGREQGSMAFRVRSTELTSLVNRVEHTWKTMAPGQPFIYSFMDEDFDAIYKAEQRTGRISITFSALAILIACLGLFGLAAYAAEQRTKEIGIRKVLGASVRNIINMLSKDFLKLVLIAALITFPFAWWAMNAWLQSFAYRIRIGWWVFALTGLLALMIAVLTVSFQAIRAALANPARSLRSE